MVIKLRKGVTFHNGKSLDSSDVVATINYHIGPDSKSPAKDVLGGVATVAADGPDTVVVNLKSGNLDFPVSFSRDGIVISGTPFLIADLDTLRGAERCFLQMQTDVARRLITSNGA